MTSLILRTASRFLISLLLLYSVFLLIRGHNFPGGGFVGGLVAASAWALHGIAYGESQVRKSLRADPRALIGLGLGVAILSGFAGVPDGRPFLSGVWTIVGAGENGVAIGSPILFDVGVYLVVLGTTLSILLGMEAET